MVIINQLPLGSWSRWDSNNKARNKTKQEEKNSRDETKRNRNGNKKILALEHYVWTGYRCHISELRGHLGGRLCSCPQCSCGPCLFRAPLHDLARNLAGPLSSMRSKQCNALAVPQTCPQIRLGFLLGPVNGGRSLSPMLHKKRETPCERIPSSSPCWRCAVMDWLPGISRTYCLAALGAGSTYLGIAGMYTKRMLVVAMQGRQAPKSYY